MAEVVSTTQAPALNTERVQFYVLADQHPQIDDIQMVGGSWGNASSVYSYDSGNKLLSMTKNNVASTFSYDAWGRMTTRTRDSVTTGYTYRYGGKLYSVDIGSDGSDERQYVYGGDGKLRWEYHDGGSEMLHYYYDMGWNRLIDEDGSAGVVTRTYTIAQPGAAVSPVLGFADGSNPSTGTWRFLTHDHLGSTRNLWDSTKSAVGDYAYAPYGEPVRNAGKPVSGIGPAFTGKPYDADTGLYWWQPQHYDPVLGVFVNPKQVTPPRTGPIVITPGGLKKGLKALLAPLTAAACVACSVGLLGIEVIAVAYEIPLDDFVCQELKKNRALRVSCAGCTWWLDLSDAALEAFGITEAEWLDWEYWAKKIAQCECEDDE